MASLDLKDRYKGETARQYDAEREGSPKWQREQAVVSTYLREIVEASDETPKVLDVPVGTGRFFPFYTDLQVQVTGVDVSGDMLKLARERADEYGFTPDLQEGEITSLSLREDCVDVAVCIRLFNWLTPDTVNAAIGELARVSRRHVILGVRIRERKPPRRHPLEAALQHLKRGVRRAFKVAWKRSTPKPSLIIHAEDEIDSSLERHSLTVARKEFVHRRRKDGAAYYIYLLSKRGGSST